VKDVSPKFYKSVEKQINLIVNKIANYTLPVIEGIKGEYVTHNPALPRFTSFKFPLYIFKPKTITDLGIFNIKGQLWNNYTYTSIQFMLNVTNMAPYFVIGKIVD
jgi:hypothetical protein